MTQSGTGHAKLILFGEHAAVYGASAVGIQLPFRIRLTWTKLGIKLQSPKENDTLHELLQDAAKISGNKTLISGLWKQKSSILNSGGFGSSSALCVALARVVLNAKNELYNRDVHDLANQLEKRFHGTPSGIDTGLSSHPGCTAWLPRKGNVPEPKLLNFPPLYLIYSAIARVEKTKASVKNIRRERNNKQIEKIQDLAKISQTFIDIAEDSKTDQADFRLKTNRLINTSQRLLADLGLSVHELNRVLELSHFLGMKSGKLSGAGMGGAFFLSAPDKKIRDKALQKLPELIRREGIKLSEPLRALNTGYQYDR